MELFLLRESTLTWHEGMIHILECHTVEWLSLDSLHQAGCGLMGEQGAESIHAKFNSLKRTYSSIRNPLDKLKSIMT